MCLEYIEEELTQEYQKKEQPVVAYKVVIKDRATHSYYPVFVSFQKPFGIGENVAKSVELNCLDNCRELNRKKYNSGFHAYLHKEDAIDVSLSSETVIEIFINGGDINCVGTQSNRLVVVASKITIKSFDDLNVL